MSQEKQEEPPLPSTFNNNNNNNNRNNNDNAQQQQHDPLRIAHTFSSLTDATMTPPRTRVSNAVIASQITNKRLKRDFLKATAATATATISRSNGGGGGGGATTRVLPPTTTSSRSTKKSNKSYKSGVSTTTTSSSRGTGGGGGAGGGIGGGASSSVYTTTTHSSLRSKGDFFQAIREKLEQEKYSSGIVKNSNNNNSNNNSNNNNNENQKNKEDASSNTVPTTDNTRHSPSDSHQTPTTNTTATSATAPAPAAAAVVMTAADAIHAVQKEPEPNIPFLADNHHHHHHHHIDNDDSHNDNYDNYEEDTRSDGDDYGDDYGDDFGDGAIPKFRPMKVQTNTAFETNTANKNFIGDIRESTFGILKGDNDSNNNEMSSKPNNNLVLPNTHLQTPTRHMLQYRYKLQEFHGHETQQDGTGIGCGSGSTTSNNLVLPEIQQQEHKPSQYMLQYRSKLQGLDDNNISPKDGDGSRTSSSMEEDAEDNQKDSHHQDMGSAAVTAAIAVVGGQAAAIKSQLEHINDDDIDEDSDDIDDTDAGMKLEEQVQNQQALLKQRALKASTGSFSHNNHKTLPVYVDGNNDNSISNSYSESYNNSNSYNNVDKSDSEDPNDASLIDKTESSALTAPSVSEAISAQSRVSHASTTGSNSGFEKTREQQMEEKVQFHALANSGNVRRSNKSNNKNDDAHDDDDDDGSEDSYDPAALEGRAEKTRYQQLQDMVEKHATVATVAVGAAGNTMDNDDDDSYDPEIVEASMNSGGSASYYHAPQPEQQPLVAAKPPPPFQYDNDDYSDSDDSYDPDAPARNVRGADDYDEVKGDVDDLNHDLENQNQNDDRTRRLAASYRQRSQQKKAKRKVRIQFAMLMCLVLLGFACIAVGLYIALRPAENDDDNNNTNTPKPTTAAPVFISNSEPSLTPTIGIRTVNPTIPTASATNRPTLFVGTEPPVFDFTTPPGNPMAVAEAATAAPDASPADSTTSDSLLTIDPPSSVPLTSSEPTVVTPAFEAPTQDINTTTSPTTELTTEFLTSSEPTVATAAFEAPTQDINVTSQPTEFTTESLSSVPPTSIEPTVATTALEAPTQDVDVTSQPTEFTTESLSSLPPTSIEPTVATTALEAPTQNVGVTSQPTEFVVLANLPDDTWAAIATDPASPQAQAFRWMVDDPILESFSQWQQEQRFSLVVSYYSWFDGITIFDTEAVAAAERDNGQGRPRPNSLGGRRPSPPASRRSLQDAIRSDWLDYNSSECHWYYMADVDADETNESYEIPDSELVTASRAAGQPNCNDDGGYEHLSVAVDKDAMPGTVTDIYLRDLPREISLLTDLKSISMPNNKVPTTLMDFLPDTFLQLTKLREVDFSQSKISEWNRQAVLRFPPSIERLDLSYNEMQGPLLEEIGLIMTSLTDLYLTGNQIAGPIPIAIPSWTRLRNFYVAGNNLTGSLVRCAWVLVAGSCCLYFHLTAICLASLDFLLTNKAIGDGLAEFSS